MMTPTVVTPTAAAACCSMTRARPKSATIAMPSESRMFSGLMSRWTSPRRWQWRLRRAGEGSRRRRVSCRWGARSLQRLPSGSGLGSRRGIAALDGLAGPVVLEPDAEAIQLEGLAVHLPAPVHDGHLTRAD